MEDALQAVFLKILNMSLTAGYVIVAVLLVRLALRRAPKKWSYLLWSVAGFRLCCPVSFRSALSLLRLGTLDRAAVTASAATSAMEYIPPQIGYMGQPRVNLGLPAVSDAVNAALPAAEPAWSANPMQVWMFLGACVWVAGVLAMLLYGAVSGLLLRKRLREAVLREPGVYETDRICTPLILGLLRPRIYLPLGLEPEPLRYVLAHERCHLRRRDYLVKFFAWLLLAVHWFNPLVWLSFCLLCRDMEMSCDEAVLAKEGDIAENYSLTLLGFAVNRRFPGPSPLAFGETGVRDRIRNVLRWKHPRRWVTAAALLLVLAAAVAFASNPPARDTDPAGQPPAGGAAAGEDRERAAEEEEENHKTLWSWTSTVSRADMERTPEYSDVGWDPPVSRELTEEETETLVALLNAVPREAVYFSRGIPSGRTLDIPAGPGYHLRFDAGVLEVDFDDPALGRELYGEGEGVWCISDAPLYVFLDDLALDAGRQRISEEANAPLVTVSTRDAEAIPYPALRWAETQGDNGWMTADGIPLPEALADRWEEIPALTMSGFLAVSLGSYVMPAEPFLRVYDAEWNEVLRGDSLGLRELDGLEPGEYCCVLRVIRLGDYAAEPARFAQSGWDCVLRLTVNAASVSTENLIIEALNSDGAYAWNALDRLTDRLMDRPAETLEAMGAYPEGILDWLCYALGTQMSPMLDTLDLFSPQLPLSPAGAFARERLATYYLQGTEDPPLDWRSVYRRFLAEYLEDLPPDRQLYGAALMDFNFDGVPELVLWGEAAAGVHSGVVYDTDGRGVYFNMGNMGNVYSTDIPAGRPSEQAIPLWRQRLFWLARERDSGRYFWCVHTGSEEDGRYRGAYVLLDYGSRGDREEPLIVAYDSENPADMRRVWETFNDSYEAVDLDYSAFTRSVYAGDVMDDQTLTALLNAWRP